MKKRKELKKHEMNFQCGRITRYPFLFITEGFFFALFRVILIAPAQQMVDAQFQFEVVLCRIIDMQKTLQPSQQRSAMSFAISFYKMVCDTNSPF